MERNRHRPPESSPLEEVERVKRRFERLFREAERCLPPLERPLQGETVGQKPSRRSDKQLTLGWLSARHLLRNFPMKRAAALSTFLLILGAAIYLGSRGPRSPEPGMKREAALTATLSRAQLNAGAATSSAAVVPEAETRDSFPTGATAEYERQAQPTVLLEPRNQEDLDHLLLDPAARQELVERIDRDRSFQVHRIWPTAIPAEYSPSDLAILVQHGILTPADVELLQVIEQATQRTAHMKE